MAISIETKRVDPDIVVVTIAGKVALGEPTQGIQRQFEELVGQNEKKILFDLTGVQYIDSSGIGIIALCSNKLKQAGGQLRVAGAKGPVENIFKLIRMQQIVALYPTPADALQDFR